MEALFCNVAIDGEDRDLIRRCVLEASEDSWRTLVEKLAEKYPGVRVNASSGGWSLAISSLPRAPFIPAQHKARRTQFNADLVEWEREHNPPRGSHRYWWAQGQKRLAEEEVSK